MNRMYLAILAILLIPTLSYSSFTKSLDYGWEISEDGNRLKDVSIGSRWSNFSNISKGNAKVLYQSRFEHFLADAEEPVFIIIPPSWLPYHVNINGIEIGGAALRSSVRGSIYGYEFLELNPKEIKEFKTISIFSEGNPILGGFRDDSLIITSNSQVLNRFKIFNFFKNDIYWLFIAASVIYGLIFIALGIKVHSERLAYMSLGIGSLLIIPHHLLTTSLYTYFKNPDSVFKAQLFFQTIAWPAFSIYFLSNSKTKAKLVDEWLRKKSVILGIILVYIVNAILAVTLSLNIYGGQVAPLFFVSIVFATPFGIYANRYNPMFLLMATSGYLIGCLSFLSDISPLEFHFLGYATTLMSTSGLYLVFRDFIKFFNVSYSASSLLSATMPDSVYLALVPLMEEGASTSKIRKLCDGNAYIFTIFVDIIGWGEMGADLAVDPLNFAKRECFRRIGLIFQKYEIEFVKPIGDCAHFVAGLPFGQATLSETELAAKVTRAIFELLDSLTQINVELAQRNCPKIKIKASCSYGHCGFGFDGVSNKFRFDLAGDSVNIAKRLEENMTKQFYEKYGENVALISEQVIRMAASKAPDVISRFKEEFTAKDKHDKYYPARVGRQFPDHKPDDLKAMLDGMYGKHAQTTSGAFKENDQKKEDPNNSNQ